jgi:hypothetical protein
MTAKVVTGVGWFTAYTNSRRAAVSRATAAPPERLPNGCLTRPDITKYVRFMV